MKPSFDKVLQLAVDEGAKRGIRRFFKHREHGLESLRQVNEPAYTMEDALADTIAEEILNSIYEWFDTEETED